MKKVISRILLFGGILGAVGANIAAQIFAAKNPYMTEILFVENPKPAIICVCSAIAAWVGGAIIMKEETP